MNWWAFWGFLLGSVLAAAAGAIGLYLAILEVTPL
jgi:hypothetical protein